MNRSFTSNFTVNTTKHYFLTKALILSKMGRMDTEQAVFKQFTLSDSKKWSSTTLKTFNIYTIMTNNSDKIRIS